MGRTGDIKKNEFISAFRIIESRKLDGIAEITHFTVKSADIILMSLCDDTMTRIIQPDVQAGYDTFGKHGI